MNALNYEVNSIDGLKWSQFIGHDTAQYHISIKIYQSTFKH